MMNAECGVMNVKTQAAFKSSFIIPRSSFLSERVFDEAAHPLGARVPGAALDRALPRERGRGVALGERFLHEPQELFAAARDAQHPAHVLVLGQRRDDHGLARRHVLANLYRRPVARERALSFPRQHAHIKARGVARQLFVRDGRQEVRVRQRLDLDAARLVAYEDPMPAGALGGRAPYQLLVYQPRLYRAEVAEARTRYARDLLGDREPAAAYARPVLEVHGLLQKVGALAPARRLFQQLAARVEDDVGALYRVLVHAPYGGGVGRVVHRVLVVLVRDLVDDERLVEAADHLGGG